MAQYLSSETIRAAVERLSTCAANSTLTDFLIFRRALKNSSPATKAATQVVTGTQSEPFRRAIEEMTSCATTGMNWSGQPHYSPALKAHARPTAVVIPMKLEHVARAGLAIYPAAFKRFDQHGEPPG